MGGLLGIKGAGDMETWFLIARRIKDLAENKRIAAER
jgi:hypothetical protein